MKSNNDLIERLEKCAEIRRQISTRKSVQECTPDRIADLLEEAAREIKRLREFAIDLIRADEIEETHFDLMSDDNEEI